MVLSTITRRIVIACVLVNFFSKTAPRIFVRIQKKKKKRDLLMQGIFIGEGLNSDTIHV